MTIAGIGGYYYMQGQYDDKVREKSSHHYLMMADCSRRGDATMPILAQQLYPPRQHNHIH